jgi:hypothetical protein
MHHEARIIAIARLQFICLIIEFSPARGHSLSLSLTHSFCPSIGMLQLFTALWLITTRCITPTKIASGSHQ